MDVRAGNYSKRRLTKSLSLKIACSLRSVGQGSIHPRAYLRDRLEIRGRHVTYPLRSVRLSACGKKLASGARNLSQVSAFL